MRFCERKSLLSGIRWQVSCLPPIALQIGMGSFVPLFGKMETIRIFSRSGIRVQATPECAGSKIVEFES